MTVTEAAEKLQVSRARVHQLIKKRRLSAKVRLKGAVAYYSLSAKQVSAFAESDRPTGKHIPKS